MSPGNSHSGCMGHCLLGLTDANSGTATEGKVLQRHHRGALRCESRTKLAPSLPLRHPYGLPTAPILGTNGSKKPAGCCLGSAASPGPPQPAPVCPAALQGAELHVVPGLSLLPGRQPQCLGSPSPGPAQKPHHIMGREGESPQKGRARLFSYPKQSPG